MHLDCSVVVHAASHCSLLDVYMEVLECGKDWLTFVPVSVKLVIMIFWTRKKEIVSVQEVKLSGLQMLMLMWLRFSCRFWC